MAKESVVKAVRGIRAISAKVKDKAESNSERTMGFLNSKLTAWAFYIAALRSLMALLNSAMVGLRVACTTEARAAAVTLVRHVLMDFGSRINEAGNLVEALGQHEEFAAACERVEQAWGEAGRAETLLRKERQMGFERDDRVVLVSAEPSSTKKPPGSVGTVRCVIPVDRKAAKSGDEHLQSAYERLYLDDHSRGVLLSIKWDDGGYDRLVLPVDEVKKVDDTRGPEKMSPRRQQGELDNQECITDDTGDTVRTYAAGTRIKLVHASSRGQRALPENGAVGTLLRATWLSDATLHEASLFHNPNHPFSLARYLLRPNPENCFLLEVVWDNFEMPVPSEFLLTAIDDIELLGTPNTDSHYDAQRTINALLASGDYTALKLQEFHNARDSLVDFIVDKVEEKRPKR